MHGIGVHVVLLVTLILIGAHTLTDETKEEMQQAGVKLVCLTSQLQHGGWPKGRSSWYHLPERLIHQGPQGMGGAVLLVKAAQNKLQLYV